MSRAIVVSVERIVRIGGASGFWGETALALSQLLGAGSLDYLVFDYLAEITMSIMARGRAEDPSQGYARDFVSEVLEPHLATLAAKSIKVISNAGGVNPRACGDAVRALVEAQGLDLKVAVVLGDDLAAQVPALSKAGVTEMFSGASFPNPRAVASVNAYLGAFPIAMALDRGADIVITGRIADSAATLGPCIHAFGWSPDDLDALAGASVAGHILECSTQATGGNFTDWANLEGELFDMGYPMAEIASDGSFVCTKPEGTSGEVSPATVGEQLLYEIGDPRAYILPDVVCDFTSLELVEIGPNRVRVSGARGRPPTETYKVSATYADGFRGGTVLNYFGRDAARKGRAFAQLALRRAEAKLQSAGLGSFDETLVEVVGGGDYFPDSKADLAREVAVKLAAKHRHPKGVAALLKETIGAALAAPPGLTIFAGGRPKPSPVVRLFSFLHPKTHVPVTLEIDGDVATVEVPAGQPPSPLAAPSSIPDPHFEGPSINVPLFELAWGRSGDKGDKANIGIMARRPEYLPYIWAALTEAAVAARFGHLISGRVERFLLPGTHAVNFLLHEALGGGGIASLRNDPQGKAYAQLLLEHPIPVPADLTSRAMSQN